MALRLKRIEGYLDTVWAIAASKYVEQFLIGYTYRAAIHRFAEYKSQAYDHLVILADRLTESDAKALEKILQSRVRDDKRRAYFQRYNKRRRGKRYYPGRKSPKPYKKIHSVYMAWWEP
jgi:hypothetical protein